MSDGLWMSVSEAADQRGVSKQAISKRLKGLEGRVSTKKDGQKLLINMAEYDRVTQAETDPSQALRNRALPPRDPRQGPAAVSGPAPEPRPQDLAQRVFSTQRAKRESYEAESARLDLEERLGKLLPVKDVEDAMVRCATAIIRLIDALPAESEDPAIRVILKRKAVELRLAVAAEMTLLASGAAQADPVSETGET